MVEEGEAGIVARHPAHDFSFGQENLLQVDGGIVMRAGIAAGGDGWREQISWLEETEQETKDKQNNCKVKYLETAKFIRRFPNSVTLIIS